MYGKGGKNRWALFLLILAGIVVGGVIGEYLGGYPGLGWLRFGDSFGSDTPGELLLGIVELRFALMVRINVASIIGIILSIFVYRKI